MSIFNKLPEVTLNKSLVLSHNDLDGVGCITLFKLFDIFGDVPNLEWKTNAISYINDNVTYILDNIEEYNQFDSIFITDISINPEVAERIDKVNKKDKKYGYPTFILLDHHNTAKSLNKYDWAVVESKVDGVPTSGTDLVYRFFQHYNLVTSNSISTFVKAVNEYDNWIWESTNNMMSRDLGLVFNKFKNKDFIELIISSFNKDKLVLPKELKTVIDIELSSIEREIKYCEKYLSNTTEVYGMDMLIFTGIKHINEVGSYFSKYLGVDGVIMINMGYTGLSISIRGDEMKDLGAWAKQHFSDDDRNAGGHAGACGIGVYDTVNKNLINKLLS